MAERRARLLRQISEKFILRFPPLLQFPSQGNNDTQEARFSGPFLFPASCCRPSTHRSTVQPAADVMNKGHGGPAAGRKRMAPCC